MGQDSKISWTNHTFSSWWGCEKVSPACDHCYAEGMANRFEPGLWGKNAKRRFFGDKHWQQPLRWDRAAAKAGKKAFVFSASMSDVFEDREDLIPTRTRLWKLIQDTPNLIWQLLTKRPENIRKMLPPSWLETPRENVWLGISGENQRRLDERMEHLHDIPAKVRWVSYEPALEALDLSKWKSKLDWLIIGGESGHGARPMPLEWVTSALDQCRRFKIKPFVKQLGGYPDKRDDLTTWPKEIQVREFP